MNIICIIAKVCALCTVYDWFVRIEFPDMKNTAPNLTIHSVMNELEVITVDCQVLRHLHKSGLKMLNNQANWMPFTELT